MFYRRCYRTLSVFLLTGFVTSCSVTMVPTDASSLSLEQTTDGSSDFSSNVTFDSGDQAANGDEKAIEKFVSTNFTRLRADMSVGHGEHLTTLAVLMSVDETDKEKFYAVCQNNFSSIFPSTQLTEKEVIVNLRQELAGENI